MGDLTRAQLRAEVIANLGDRDDLESGDGLTTINRALGRAQTRIARANFSGWSELTIDRSDPITITGVIATDAYIPSTNLPDELDKVKSIFVLMEGQTKTSKVTQMLKSQWDTLIGDASVLSTSSVIRHYADIRISALIRRIYWYPVPNIDYTWYLSYTKLPTAFADDDAVSDFDNKDDLIIATTTHYMFNRYQAFEEAEQWRKGFRSQLNEAILDDKIKPDVQAVPMGISVGNTKPLNDPWRDPFYKG